MSADIAWAVAEARAAEAATHTDVCTITRPDPDNPGTWNPATGETLPGVLVVQSALPCRLRSPSQSERAAMAGEFQWSVRDAVLRVDTGATGIRMGDTVTFDSSPQGVAMDGPFTVISPMSGSHMSSLRFVVRDAS